MRNSTRTGVFHSGLYRMPRRLPVGIEIALRGSAVAGAVLLLTACTPAQPPRPAQDAKADTIAAPIQTTQSPAPGTPAPSTTTVPGSPAPVGLAPSGSTLQTTIQTTQSPPPGTAGPSATTVTGVSAPAPTTSTTGSNLQTPIQTTPSPPPGTAGPSTGTGATYKPTP
jgi:hypothetical protein